MSLASEYDQWHTRVLDADPGRADESSPWYQLVREYLPPVHGKHILEVACGRGGFSQLLASENAKVCGADFSESAIRIAKEKLLGSPGLEDRATYVQADVQNLPFDQNSFDIVISCETIEHVPNPRAAVREMYRVCKPGGMLYLTTPNYMNFMGAYGIYAALCKTKKRSDFDQPLDRHSLFFQTRKLVRSSGWRILHSDGTVYQVVIPGRNPVTLRIVEKYRWIRRCLRPLALHYLVVARKEDFPR